MIEQSAEYFEQQHINGKSWTEIAEDIGDGSTADSIRSRVKRLRRKQREISVPITTFGIPPSKPTTDEKPIRIDGLANALIIGDLHVPHHNSVMLERAIKITKKHFPHIKTIVVGGDLFDFSSISIHPHNAAQEEINKSIRLAGDVMRALFDPFDKAILVNGNHDERVAKKLDSNFDFQLLVNAALGQHWPKCNIQVSNMDYLYINENWIIGHPSNYSGQGGKTPSDLADLYQKNVITFHNHVIGFSQSKSGKYIGIDAGHSTIESEHYYKERRLSKFTRWNSGFVILSNDYFYTFSEHFTDWKLYDL